MLTKSAIILVIGAIIVFAIPFLINYQPEPNTFEECRQLPTASTRVC